MQTQETTSLKASDKAFASLRMHVKKLENDVAAKDAAVAELKRKLADAATSTTAETINVKLEHTDTIAYNMRIEELQFACKQNAYLREQACKQEEISAYTAVRMRGVGRYIASLYTMLEKKDS